MRRENEEVYRNEWVLWFDWLFDFLKVGLELGWLVIVVVCGCCGLFF